MVATDGVVVMNAATVLLARAEAAERGWTTENAGSIYTDAVTVGMAQWGYTGAPVAGYLAQSGVVYTGTSAAKRDKIAIQKWIALYPDGLQAWNEWRRTGVPVLVPSIYPVNETGEIPRRFVYGNTEYGNNNANVKAAAALLSGGDTQDARMWWDK
jgi:hypothetical protein